MEQALRVRVSGPLAAYVPELMRHLADQGYADWSVTYSLVEDYVGTGYDPSHLTVRAVVPTAEGWALRGERWFV